MATCERISVDQWRPPERAMRFLIGNAPSPFAQPGANPHAGRHPQSPGAAADAVACFGHEKYDCYRSSNSRGGMWQLNEQLCA
jgi:hypothetical protein